MLNIFETAVTSRYMVAKVVHRKMSDHHCKWSDIWPLILLSVSELYQQTSSFFSCLKCTHARTRACVRTHTHTYTHTHMHKHHTYSLIVLGFFQFFFQSKQFGFLILISFVSKCFIYYYFFIYELVTKGHDLKWDALPQIQTPSKLFSVLPL